MGLNFVMFSVSSEWMMVYFMNFIHTTQIKHSKY